jgi:hypothetical protein
MKHTTEGVESPPNQFKTARNPVPQDAPRYLPDALAPLRILPPAPAGMILTRLMGAAERFNDPLLNDDECAALLLRFVFNELVAETVTRIGPSGVPTDENRAWTDDALEIMAALDRYEDEFMALAAFVINARRLEFLETQTRDVATGCKGKGVNNAYPEIASYATSNGRGGYSGGVTIRLPNGGITSCSVTADPPGPGETSVRWQMFGWEGGEHLKERAISCFSEAVETLRYREQQRMEEAR